MKKLAIITTHPIQYNAPLFQLLTKRGTVGVKVFYTWGEGVTHQKFDPGFGQHIQWDIPLLEGYDFCFVKNLAKNPGSHHFNGIVNPSLIEDIEQWAPQALLVYGWSFNSHLKCLRHFRGKIPILFRGDSTLLQQNSWSSFRSISKRIFLNWVYRHISIALFVGAHNRAYFKRFGIKDQQLVFAPHAIDMNRFKNESLDVERPLLNLPDKAFVFLFAGKLEAIKNPMLLLNAFIAFNHPMAHLVMVGSGALESQLKLIALQQVPTLRARIHFLPFQNQQQMPAIYKMGDAFVLPSVSETWGLAINEAMACGKAILVSDQCGCAQDLVNEGVNGYIFKSDDKIDLIEKMKSLMAASTRSREMGKQSLALIQSWSFENVCAAINKALSLV